jgi:hypothetical protein
MPTDPNLAPGPAEPEAGGNGAAPATATREKRRVVVSTSRPFFYNAEGERVELSPEAMGGEATEVDAAAVNALGTGDTAGAHTPAPARGDGAPPLAPDAKPIYADASRQIFLNPNTALQVGSRPAGAPATAAPSAPASPSPVPAT